MTSKFHFGIDGKRPVWRGWPGESPKSDPPPRPDHSGIVHKKGFGRVINGISDLEAAKVQHEMREKFEKLDQSKWDDIASKCWKLARIKKPRLRAMAANIFFGGMHDNAPADLEEYAQDQGISTIEAAEELSSVGGFTETDRGYVQPEIRWDSDDEPDPDDDPDDEGGEFYLAEVEA